MSNERKQEIERAAAEALVDAVEEIRALQRKIIALEHELDKWKIYERQVCRRMLRGIEHDIAQPLYDNASYTDKR